MHVSARRQATPAPHARAGISHAVGLASASGRVTCLVRGRACTAAGGAAKKLPVPEGTWSIGAGLLIVGLSAYGFQILAAKRLSSSDYDSLNVLWAMVFVFTPGLFQPLEQEVGRAVAARRVRGEGGGARRASAPRSSAALALAVAVHRDRLPSSTRRSSTSVRRPGHPAVRPVHRDRAATTSRSSPGVHCRATAASAPTGSCTGPRARSASSACVVLFAVGTDCRRPVGLALAAPPLFAVHRLAARPTRAHDSRARRRRTPSSRARWPGCSLGSVLAQLLSYASVFGVNRLATTQHEKDLASALHHRPLHRPRTPARRSRRCRPRSCRSSPALASEGKHDDFRIGMRGSIDGRRRLVLRRHRRRRRSSVRGSARSCSPSKWDLGHRDMFLLTLAATAFILALTLAQGLIALKAYKAERVRRGSSASCVRRRRLALGNDLILRNELGFLAGGAAAAIVMAALLIPRMRRSSATPRGPGAGRRARDPRDLMVATMMRRARAPNCPKSAPPHRLPALVRLARPKQWIKNVLVVAAPGRGRRARATAPRSSDTIDRVRLLLSRRERHLLLERRARRRSRPRAPHQTEPPDRVGRGLGAHRDHRRRAPRRRVDRALVRGALAALARRRRIRAADDPLQRVAEARSRCSTSRASRRDSSCARSRAVSRSA